MNRFQSNGACLDTCKQNFAFAIVQGSSCWCSDYVPGLTNPINACDEQCPGYGFEYCGSSAKGLFGYVALNKPPAGTQAGSSTSSSVTTSVASQTVSPQNPFVSDVSSTETSCILPTGLHGKAYSPRLRLIVSDPCRHHLSLPVSRFVVIDGCGNHLLSSLSQISPTFLSSALASKTSSSSSFLMASLGIEFASEPWLHYYLRDYHRHALRDRLFFINLAVNPYPHGCDPDSNPNRMVPTLCHFLFSLPSTRFPSSPHSGP